MPKKMIREAMYLWTSERGHFYSVSQVADIAMCATSTARRNLDALVVEGMVASFSEDGVMRYHWKQETLPEVSAEDVPKWMMWRYTDAGSTD